MNVPRDTFVAFVDALAERLDDEEVTGADLASLVHLSRFHFARLVSSEAGESPSRFRRRILLERSAYRLITTGTGVLDIGLEAGSLRTKRSPGRSAARTTSRRRAFGPCLARC